MNNYGTLDYIILTLVTVEMFASIIVNGMAALRAQTPIDRLYGTVCALSVFMFGAYIFLWFNLDHAGDWSRVMRGVGVFSIAVVWMGPALAAMHFLKLRKNVINDLVSQQRAEAMQYPDAGGTNP